jgi:hypothetical protein
LPGPVDKPEFYDGNRLDLGLSVISMTSAGVVYRTTLAIGQVNRHAFEHGEFGFSGFILAWDVPRELLTNDVDAPDAFKAK